MRVVILIAVLSLAAPLAAQEQDPKREFPAGWKMRLDRANADASQVAFWTMPPGWHITTGPACILYEPGQTASGQYRIESTNFLFDPGERREAYGVFFGGKDLAGDGQTYSYFLIRRDGRFLVKHRAGAETREITSWTEHAAIVKWDGSTPTAKNTLAVDVGSQEVIFSVNGTEVARLPRSQLSTEGVVGLRINHSLNIHVTDLKVEKKSG